jgi:two-component system, NarL family, nitrate/nitrite response regulator NarL
MVILLDVATEDGLAAARRLAETAPEVQLLGFAARAQDHDVLAYAQAGITGFVPRDASTEDLFAAIERASRGEFLCSPRIAATLFRHLATLASVPHPAPAAGTLTDREREILRCIDEGITNKEIARRLCIEVSTVKNHVHNILDKPNVRRRGEAAARLRAIPGDLVPMAGAPRSDDPFRPASPPGRAAGRLAAPPAPS